MWSNPRVPYELASKRKLLKPPDGKPIIVHVVMNVEYWPFDKNMPRGILPPPHGKIADPPDLPNFSWVEYGMRVGLPRLMKLFYENNIPVSAFINAQVAQIYSSAFEEICKLKWELVGHGLGEHLHESPEVPNYGKRGRGPKLQDGLVIAIEPMINMGVKNIRQHSDGWTITTADNKQYVSNETLGKIFDISAT